MNQIPSSETTLTGAAYIRVSTGKQEELSPDSQKRLILDYAQAHQIHIPEEFIFMEHGISGRNAEKRPKFQQMIALAKAKKFQVILLWKFSRFARNQEESIVYKSMLRKNGIDVISISEPLAEGPFGSLIERIIEWMDEFYSIRLSGDVTRGMTEKALRGGCQCRPPLGYRIPSHNAPLEIVPEEAVIIRMIFHDYVLQRLSCYQIAKKLNALGLKTSQGKLFQTRSVEYILDNPCYAGIVRWNRKEQKTNLIRQETEWIVRQGKYESIISAELFQQAQMLRSKQTGIRSPKPSEACSHWLSGLLKCSACGRSLTISGHKNKRGSIYYSFQCCGYAKGQCSISHSISVNKIVPVVLSALEAAESPGSTKFTVSNLINQKQADEEKKRWKKQIEALEKKKKRIRDAYQEGVDTLEEYQYQKMLFMEEENQLETLMEGSVHKYDRLHLDEFTNHTIVDLLKSDICSTNQKSTVIRSITDKIIYDKANSCIMVYYHDFLHLL